jgi:hypothetical protein
MKTLFSLTVLCLSSTAFAALPTGDFSGYANSNSFNEFCVINQAEVSFVGSTSGTTELTWEEHGNQAQGGGFCDHYFDASLTPTSVANTWDVSFDYDSNLVFGKATLVGNTIEITAQNIDFNHAYSNLRATFIVNPSANTLSYSRMLESDFGPTRFANGLLNR